VRRGDVIRKIDGKVVRGNDDLLAEISSRRPGEKVELQVYRDGKTFETTARLGERNPENLRAGVTRQRSGQDKDGESISGEATGLGMTVETFDPQVVSSRMRLRVDQDLRGVIVSDVDFGSQADDKGIQPGNVIVSINDKPVSDIGDWKKQLEKVDEGDTVKLDLARLDGSSIGFVFLTVTD
jgi:serine protease Do